MVSISLCLSNKSLTSWQTKFITSLHTIQNVRSLLLSISFSHLWYYLSKLITNKSSHLHLMLGILTFSFFIFRLYLMFWSCYSHPEACHFVTDLKSEKGRCSNQCGPELSEGKYWWIHSTIPHIMCFRAICWAICKLYYGYWHWFVIFLFFITSISYCPFSIISVLD